MTLRDTSHDRRRGPYHLVIVALLLIALPAQAEDIVRGNGLADGTTIVVATPTEDRLAWGTMMVGGGTPAAGGGYVEQVKSPNFTEDAYHYLGSLGPDTTKSATQFITVGAYTLTKVEVRLLKTASAAQNSLLCEIWSDDGATDYPSTSLGQATTTYNPSTDLTTSYATYSFLFSGVSLSATTKYFLVCISTPASGSEYLQWGTNTSDAGITRQGRGGGDWLPDNSYMSNFITYSGGP